MTSFCTSPRSNHSEWQAHAWREPGPQGMQQPVRGVNVVLGKVGKDHPHPPRPHRPQCHVHSNSVTLFLLLTRKLAEDFV